METLEDFNKRRRDERWKSGYVSGAPVPNGIACPECGDALYDSRPGVQLYSDPAQIYVACTCGSQGFVWPNA